VNEKIRRAIQMHPSDILEVMQEIERGEAYNFMLKWFDEKAEADNFIAAFDESVKEKMNDAGWMNSEEILPAVLEELEKLEQEQFSQPVKVKEKWVVLFLNEKRQRETADIEQLYIKASDIAYRRYFEKAMESFLRELRNKIPVHYCEEIRTGTE
jgi:parvulin-like peptidyl-prolyl isomerase